MLAVTLRVVKMKGAKSTCLLLKLSEVINFFHYDKYVGVVYTVFQKNGKKYF